MKNARTSSAIAHAPFRLVDPSSNPSCIAIPHLQTRLDSDIADAMDRVDRRSRSHRSGREVTKLECLLRVLNLCEERLRKLVCVNTDTEGREEAGPALGV